MHRSDISRGDFVDEEDCSAGVGVGADHAGGIRIADAGDIGGLDAVWIGDVLHRVHVDALGSWIGDGVLRGWDCFDNLRFGKNHFLLRYGPAFFPQKRDSCMEAFVKERRRLGRIY